MTRKYVRYFTYRQDQLLASSTKECRHYTEELLDNAKRYNTVRANEDESAAQQINYRDPDSEPGEVEAGGRARAVAYITAHARKTQIRRNEKKALYVRIRSLFHKCQLLQTTKCVNPVSKRGERPQCTNKPEQRRPRNTVQSPAIRATPSGTSASTNPPSSENTGTPSISFPNLEDNSFFFLIPSHPPLPTVPLETQLSERQLTGYGYKCYVHV